MKMILQLNPQENILVYESIIHITLQVEHEKEITVSANAASCICLCVYTQQGLERGAMSCVWVPDFS